MNAAIASLMPAVVAGTAIAAAAGSVSVALGLRRGLMVAVPAFVVLVSLAGR